MTDTCKLSGAAPLIANMSLLSPTIGIGLIEAYHAIKSPCDHHNTLAECMHLSHESGSNGSRYCVSHCYVA